MAISSLSTSQRLRNPGGLSAPDEARRNLGRPIQNQPAKLYDGGLVEWITTVDCPIGGRVQVTTCGFEATLIGADQGHALLKEDDGNVLAWPWSELAPVSVNEYPRDVGERRYPDDKIKNTVPALAEIVRDDLSPAIAKAKKALAEAAVEACAGFWPDQASVIQSDAPTSAV